MLGSGSPLAALSDSSYTVPQSEDFDGFKKHSNAINRL